VQRFLEVQTAYKRKVRAYTIEDWEYVPPKKLGQKPNYFLIPMIDVPDVQVTTARPGRPSKLSESDAKVIRGVLKTQPGATLAAVTRAVNSHKKADAAKVDRHTVQRFMDAHGLSLKRPSARHS
jgi:hypothetical protein